MDCWHQGKALQLAPLALHLIADLHEFKYSIQHDFSAVIFQIHNLIPVMVIKRRLRVSQYLGACQKRNIK